MAATSQCSMRKTHWFACAFIAKARAKWFAVWKTGTPFAKKVLARIRQCRISKQMKISALLKAWRKVNDSKNGRGEFTQDEAASFLGVPIKTYIDWEQGRRGPVGIALQAVEERIKLRPGKAGGRRPGKSNRTKAPPRGSVGAASKKRVSENQKSNKPKQRQRRRSGKGAASTSHA